jgi:molecular chaperone IbpA
MNHFLQSILTAQLNQLAEHNGLHRPGPFPPYDIIKHDDYNYEIRVALAGYTKSDIQVIHEDKVIRIQRQTKSDDTQNNDNTTYIHKGIAKRNFKISFPVKEYMVVKDASMVDGMLVVSMCLVIPDEVQSKIIPIS